MPQIMDCEKDSGESTSLGARPCWGPPAHRGKKHSNKRIIYWRRKEGEEEWRDERRGNTVQRHLRAVWVKDWPHLNIHSQCVTFSPTLPRWHTPQPEPIWSHCGSLLALLFKIHRTPPPVSPPTQPPFPNKTNTATYGCGLMVRFHLWNLWKPTVELSRAAPDRKIPWWIFANALHFSLNPTVEPGYEMFAAKTHEV